MKIINPFKYFREKIAEEKIKDAARETAALVNKNVYVGNDPKDPNNKIYVFCNGVPVMEVADDSVVTDSTVNINEASEVLGNIKAMYRNYLNDKPIKRYGYGQG
ncbi:MAG: hypothetical protein ACI4J7_09885 [Ruminiclostridium sp.]|uniref:hypothetical protein n=1 Tax=Ruminococcus sp. TaxID=41978 RepID=UPI003F085843